MNLLLHNVIQLFYFWTEENFVNFLLVTNCTLQNHKSLNLTTTQIFFEICIKTNIQIMKSTSFFHKKYVRKTKFHKHNFLIFILESYIKHNIDHICKKQQQNIIMLLPISSEMDMQLKKVKRKKKRIHEQ